MEASSRPHAPVAPGRFAARSRATVVAAAWAGLALVIALAVTSATWTASRSVAEAGARAQFDFAATRVVAAVNDRLSDYVQVLWGGVGLFAASPEVNRERWHAYVDALRIPERLPGMRSMSLLTHLLPEGKAEHVRVMRADGMQDYTIWPAGERERFAVQTFVAPYDPQRRRVFGYDMLVDPVRRLALDQARDTGGAVMSGRLRLVQPSATNDPVGFMIYLPVYRQGAPLGSAAERQAAIIGFVAGTFRSKMLMSEIIARVIPDPGLTFEIYDGTDPTAAELLFRSSDLGLPPPAAAGFVRVFSQTIAGRPWTFRFTGVPAFAARGAQERSDLLLFGGILTSLLIASVIFVLVLNRAQAVAANQVLSIDVARRERVEAQLRESESKFRLLFANNPLPMWACDLATRRIIEVNDAAVAKYGYSRAEFAGMSDCDLLDAGPSVAERPPPPAAPGPRASEARHRLRDGSVIDVELVSHDVLLGGREAALVVAHDITESRKAQNAIIESEQLARGIIDAALDGFVQIDQRGVVIECNRQAEAIFGWSREDGLGLTFDRFLAKVDQRQFYQQGLSRFLQTGEGLAPGMRLIAEGLKRDGSRITVEATVTALMRRNGYVFNCFIRDLTDKIAAEEQLRQAQKMEAIGKLTGGIAHDFNNILTVITGTIEILAEAVANQPQLAAVARMIDEAAERGAALTRHLLAFARKQPLQPRPVDVNALVVEATRLFRPALGEDVEIVVLPEADAWLALVDPSQLTTSLLNLAVNARDAMPDGGKLTLETGNVVLDEHYAKANPEVRPGPYVRIAVSDTGSGIAADIQDKVFEPFFTTKEVGKGTGLGLSMVYGFVKQSGGHIKLYSEEGRGTTVKLYLPRAEVEARPGEEVVETVPLAGGDETILVVEDDALVRDYVVAQLTSLGYATHAAVNAAEALAYADAGGGFDLLFTDVIMPGGMNGKELAAAIAQRRGPVKVLFTSGYTENSVVHHGRLDAGVALLSKPYRKTELAQKVREVLDRG
jgi:PAS domain S-box-containing protein